ncbi:hypothetical protein BJ741DRAFT_609965 [Chytriomyces cf. hyalinus JEL632]|nr:hypothetical protein BJ741DRAFT_609965 [Chytriomyces cf. hyalinus JEL632]
MNSAPQNSSDSIANNPTHQNDIHATAARLTGIALKVMAALFESNPNHATHHQSGILSNANTAKVRRLIGVFVSCSAKSSDQQRAKGLPATILIALLFISRIVRKAVNISGHHVDDEEKENGGNTRIPLVIGELLRDSARLFLVGLMLAEVSVSDAQTSTASWARLQNGGVEPVTSECRKKIVQTKWAALEFLDHKVVISSSNFVQWCSIVRTWVVDGLVLVRIPGDNIPSVSCRVSQYQQQQQQLQQHIPVQHSTTTVLSAFANAVSNIRGIPVTAPCSANFAPTPVSCASFGSSSSVFPHGVHEYLQRQSRGGGEGGGRSSCGRYSDTLFGQQQQQRVLHPYQRRRVSLASGRGY